MEKVGVISKASEPTPWCARMVVVPKMSGRVYICIDLNPLNQSMMREVHQWMDFPHHTFLVHNRECPIVDEKLV